MPDSKDELSKLSIGDLKKRLFWVGGTLPAGNLEKSELVAAVISAESAKAEKAAAAEQEAQQKKAAQAGPGVVRDSKPLDFEQKVGSEKEQEIVSLHILTEDQLRKKIEENGHDIPAGEVGKHFLVALCRNALKNPKERKAKPAKKPKAAEEDDEEESASTAVKEYRRPTKGDIVQIVSSDLTKRYIPNSVGKCFKIIRDDGGLYPYRLAGLEARNWFGEGDVKWPDKKKAVAKKAADRPADQPIQIMIMLDRYGCLTGELYDVQRESGDKKMWVVKGGKQVPKSDEGVGWSRVTPQEAAPPPPPPPEGPPPPSKASVAKAKEDEEPPEPVDNRDPAELSPEEIKRRLLRYGADMLGDLEEKSELVDALREAIRTRGWPPKEEKPKAKIARTDEEMVSQMEEIQGQMDKEEAKTESLTPAQVAGGRVEGATPSSQLDAATLAAAAQAGMAAATAAKAADAVEVIEGATPATPTNPSDARAARRAAAAARRKQEEAEKAAAAAKAAAEGAAAREARLARRAAAKRKQEEEPHKAEKEVVLSDGEDKEAVDAAPKRARTAAGVNNEPVSIDCDDDIEDATAKAKQTKPTSGDAQSTAPPVDHNTSNSSTFL